MNRFIVFGATGGTGKAVSSALLEAGHEVTAFVRNPERLDPAIKVQKVVTGDAMNEADVTAAIEGQDAVINTLGNAQNPYALLFGAKRTTPADICEIGTAHILSGMDLHGVERLMVVSAFGIGDTRQHASLLIRLYLRLLLKEHMIDKVRMESLVRASSTDWTLLHPPALIDEPVRGDCHTSDAGVLGKSMVARADLAGFILKALKDGSTFGKTITVSGVKE